MFEPQTPAMTAEQWETSGWALVSDFFSDGPSHAGVAYLQMLDPTRLARADLVYLTAMVNRHRRMLDALFLRYQAAAAAAPRAKDDFYEIPEELACAMRVNPRTAAADVEIARAVVDRLPVTLRTLEIGDISLYQAKQVELATRDLDAVTAGRVEAEAVPGDPRRLNSRLVKARGRHAPDAERKKTQENRTRRMAEFWSDAVEGVAGIAVQGPLEQLAQIKAAIDADAKTRATGECRPLAARRFDVVLGWARQRLGLDDPTNTPTTTTTAAPAPAPAGGDAAGAGAAAVGGAAAGPPAEAAATAPAQPAPAPAAVPAGVSERPGRCRSCGRSGPARIPINVTVSLNTLLGLTDSPGDLDGTPIPADVARELAADGTWRRWLTEPTTGQLLDAGAATYRPGSRLDRHIRGRDRTCRFPGCTIPAVRCDLDHTRAFHTADGPTTSDNLVALCRRHHRLKHETDWTYHLRPDGTVVWTAPSGIRYEQPPEHHGDDPDLNHLHAHWHATDRTKRERETGTPAAPPDTPETPDEEPPF